MAFSSNVAEQALLDSGRHCCLCHKFCGPRIELHHIKQPADGGDDSYDNCIPLCFDCHAEVRSYDPKHPKGRKYSETELRGHRNKWYEKVSKSHGLILNPDYTELDRKTFLRLRDLLPNDGSISFMRYQDYGGSFLREKHMNLQEFVWECDSPEFEFIDADLESLRAQLFHHAKGFLISIAQHTCPRDNNIDYQGISSGLRGRNPQGWHDAVAEMNNLAGQVCSTYDALIRLGRRKLAI